MFMFMYTCACACCCACCCACAWTCACACACCCRYGANSDGYDMVAPTGEGGQRCMKMAMEMADEIGGAKPVDYVNTHGTSTPVGDTMELNGIKTVFPEAGYQPYVGSTKSLSGHELGAAGVHEAIYSLIMINKGFLAESAHINELVEE